MVFIHPWQVLFSGYPEIIHTYSLDFITLHTYGTLAADKSLAAVFF